MIRQIVGKGIAGGGFAGARLASRFQLSQTARLAQPPQTQQPAPPQTQQPVLPQPQQPAPPQAEQPQPQQHAQPQPTARRPASTPHDRTPGASGERARPRLNQKLRDVTRQVKTVVDLGDASEALQIFEEGLSYLRLIQQAEGIAEGSLYGVFQGLSKTLFEKAAAAADGGSSGTLDLLVQYRVAHGYHFAHFMAAQLREADYAAALNTWIRYLEYRAVQPLCTKSFKCYDGFFRADVANLAYYALVQSLLASGAFDPKTAYRVLQTEELPSVFRVGQTAVRYRVAASMEEYRQTFGDSIDAINVELTDPNGAEVVARIAQSVERGHVRGVTAAYEQALQASAANGKPVREATLARVMGAYAELGDFDRALAVFARMVESGVTKPLTGAWETMLYCMCHPKRGSRPQPGQVELCVATMQQNGNRFTARTVAVVVGCYANLGQFDAAEEVLSGSLGPVVHLARNNYLQGLVLNDRLATAELKLKEFEADALFVPSVLVLNLFLDAHVKRGNFDAVDGILRYMRRKHVTLDLATYVILIDMHFKISRARGQAALMETILELLRDASAHDVRLNTVAMGTLIDGLSKDGANLDAARELYRYALTHMRVTPQMATAMLATELEHGLVAALVRLYEQYVRDFGASERMYNMVIRGLLRRDDDLALEYFGRFAAEPAMAPNHYTYYFLLSHFVQKDRRDVVQQLVHQLNAGALKHLGTKLPAMLQRLSLQYEVDRRLLESCT